MAFPPLSTLAQTQAHLAAGHTRAQDLAATALARAQQGEGPRVFVRLLADGARAQAQASDALRAAGMVRSPLEGLPISVKDLFDLAGLPTLAGSQVLRQAAPAARHARVVQRLNQAGAVLMGTTNMTEFAFSGIGINPHYGTPRNPWQRGAPSDPTAGHVPGGSSSGAAVSVTDGMALAAIGSDTGGSVRIPAALCGLVGFKPTARRVPMEGVLPLSTTLDSIGPLAPSVRCCAVVDAVLSGGDPVAAQALRPAPLAGLRLLAPTNWVLDGMDASVASAWQQALTRLSQAGVHLDARPLPCLEEVADINASGGFAAAEAWHWHRATLAAQPSAYDPRVASRIARGQNMTAADYLELLAQRQGWIARMTAQLQDYDALLMPTVPVVAPPLAPLLNDDAAFFAANALILRNPSLINFLDGCALTLPCHPPGSAPVGLSLAAPAGHDARLLTLGAAVEALLAAP